MAEKTQEEPANQSKSLTDSDTSEDTEVNPSVRFSIRIRQLTNIYCLGHIVDFCSTSHFYIYIVCVDRSGSLSSGAFNQLRLVTLNIVLTILY